MSAAGQLVAIAIGLAGLAGVIFTALKFNRDDTTAIVNQQTVLLGNMRTLYDSEHEQLAACTSEREALRAEVARLRGAT